MSNISHRYVFSSGGALITGTNWNDSHNVAGISTSGAVHLAGDVTLTSSLSSANGNIRATYNDTTQDLYLSSYGGASSGNAGPNLIVRGSGADAVPSIQFQFGSGSGYLNGLTLYNDSFNSTIACWQSGHRMQFYTWSPYNANTDQERLRLSSGVAGQSDYADAEFLNTGWFRIYKGTATEEKLAINGQTGEIYPHGNIVLQSAGANIDIGDATKYLQHVWMQYLSANEVRPTTGTAVTFEDIAGNARIAINDLESGVSDWAIVPSTTNTGNVGTSGNRWKAGFFGNLNIASGSTITAPGNQSITPTTAVLLATQVSSLTTSGNIRGGTSIFGATGVSSLSSGGAITSGDISLVGGNNALNNVRYVNGLNTVGIDIYGETNTGSSTGANIRFIVRDTGAGAWDTGLTIQPVPSGNPLAIFTGAVAATSLSSAGSIIVGGASSSLAGGTLTGTWATSSLVLGAFSMNADLAMGGNDITNLASIQGAATAESIGIYGLAAAAQRDVNIYTSNAAGTATLRMSFRSNANTADIDITNANLDMNSNAINAAIIGTTPAAVSTGAVVVSGTNLLFYNGTSWKVVSTS